MTGKRTQQGTDARRVRALFSRAVDFPGGMEYNGGRQFLPERLRPIPGGPI